MNGNLLRTFGFDAVGNRSSTVFMCLGILIIEVLIALLAVVSPLLAVCTVVGVLTAGFLIVKTEHCLYIFVLSIIPSPILTFGFGEVNLGFAYIIAAILTVSWLLARLVNALPAYQKTVCDHALLVLAGWALLSLLWSHDRLTGYEDLAKLCLDIAVVFLMIAIIRNKQIFKLVLTLFLFMGIVDAILALCYPYTSFFMVRNWSFSEQFGLVFKFWPKNAWVPEGRGMGFFTAHGTATTLSIAITFGIMLFCVTKNRRKRVLLITVALVLFAALISTLTKSLIGAFICGVAYVSLHLKPLKQRFFMTMFVLLAIAVVLFVLVRAKDVKTAALVVGENLQVSVEDPERETSLGSRIKLFRIGFQKLWETAGLGTGIGGFLKYSPYAYMDGSHPAVLFDLGFVGFGLWIWLLLGAYRSFVRTMKECKNEYFRRMLLIYLGGYVVILLSWFVTFSYADIYIWFYLGVGLALVHLAENSAPTTDEALPFADEYGETIVVC